MTDGGYLPVSCFSAVSLIRSAATKPRVHLLLVGVTDREARTAADYLHAQGATCDIDVIDPAAFAGLPRHAHLPMALYGRLLMQRRLPGDAARVLYLDGDTLIDRDVGPLADLALEGAVLGAVVDVGRVLSGRVEEAQRRLDLPPGGQYFNSGVLLLDWPNWQAGEFGERALQALLREPGRFTQPDQCALNQVCAGRWCPLDLVWNYQPAALLHAPRPDVIAHFLGGRKPWKPGALRHAAHYVGRFARLFAASPWRDRHPGPAVIERAAWLYEAARRTRVGVMPRTWRERSAFRNAFGEGLS